MAEDIEAADILLTEAVALNFELVIALAKPKSISELAAACRESRNDISGRLSELEQHGLVKSDYEILRVPEKEIEGVGLIKRRYYRDPGKIEKVRDVIKRKIASLDKEDYG